MKKRLISLMLVVICVVPMLTGCDTSIKNVFQKEQENVDSSSIDITKDELNSIRENSEESNTSDTQPGDELDTLDTQLSEEANDSDTQSSEETNKIEPETSTSQQTVDLGDYIDYDNIKFAINGKVYTLGKTTLQTLIDDGVPFDKDDLANAQNNLNSNSQSLGFKIELGEYWHATVYTMNDTDENKTTAECYVNELYVEVEEDKTQDVLSLAFPLDITPAQLKKMAGEPSDSSHDESGKYINDRLEYRKNSTKYYSIWGYTFQFTDNRLDYVTIDYLP